MDIAHNDTLQHLKSLPLITIKLQTDLWCAWHPLSPVVFNLWLPEVECLVSADVRTRGGSPARSPQGAEHQLFSDALLLALLTPQDVVLTQDVPVVAGLRCPQQVFGFQVAQDCQCQLKCRNRYYVQESVNGGKGFAVKSRTLRSVAHLRA